MLHSTARRSIAAPPLEVIAPPIPMWYRPERGRRNHSARFLIDRQGADEGGRISGLRVPCVGNTAVSDMEEILEGNRVGDAYRFHRC